MFSLLDSLIGILANDATLTCVILMSINGQWTEGPAKENLGKDPLYELVGHLVPRRPSQVAEALFRAWQAAHKMSIK